MMQKTNFVFEILIHDDASKDKTAEIIREYEEKYPNIIKPIYQTENQYSKGIKVTFKYNFPRAKGKYIALCEGDDYWTDPLKLQKQVDFLEANNDYVLCFHEVKILHTDGELKDDFITKVPENYETIETLARLGNYIHTPSVVFRNSIKEFPFELDHSPIGDYFLCLMLAEQGKIKYIEEVMGVYRYGVGIHSSNSAINHHKSSLKFYVSLLSYLKDEKIKEIFLEKYFASAAVYEHLMNRQYDNYFITKQPLF
jgi:glycosyltransferase involved in cell wall biosynthesis